ncbi:MAG: DUF4158 domain-containing protein [Planctomycetaceae bacterium]|nr:MAG: DUF4158 domain-containing protein [Planctomycetaceae bacterium]
MTREWQTEELIEHWALLPGEWPLVGNKHGPTRLGFAVLLKCFQSEGRFPRHPHEVPSSVVAYLAQQVGIAPRFGSTWDFGRPRWLMERPHHVAVRARARHDASA